MSDRRLAAVLIADIKGFSRLVEAAEDDTMARQDTYRTNVIDPAVRANGGEIVKGTGDGFLALFGSVRGAVTAALDMQRAIGAAEAEVSEAQRILYRMGLAAGDILHQDRDVFGGEVNVAARLEQMAEPGGLCITDAAFQIVCRHFPDTFDDIGAQSVRNIPRPIRVWQWSPERRDRMPAAQHQARGQRIGFCIAPDGTQLAYATVGEGPTLLKMPNWLNHVDYDWASPIWGPLLQDLSRNHRLIRFDQRGNGLSDWDVPEISEDAMQADVVAVADATGVVRSEVFAMSQGCAIAVKYAAAHPERVKCIVMYGGFARGTLTRRDPKSAELYAATRQLIQNGWGSTDPTFRHLFTETFIPDASPVQKASMDELQRIAAPPENVVRISDMNAEVDVSALAQSLDLPVLVMHAEGDRRVPLEEGRRLAALIPGAEFVTLPGNNHILVPGSEAYAIFLRHFEAFIGEHGG